MNVKSVMVAALLLTAVILANASEAQDTVVVEQPEQVTIRNQKNGYEVEIKGMKDNPTYHYQYKRTFESEDSLAIVKEENTDGDVSFNVPFSRYWKGERNSHRYSPHWSGWSMGFNTVRNTAKGGLNGPDGASVDMGNSAEVALNLPSVSYRVKGGLGIFTGLGVSWRNYRMNNNYRFVKEDNVTSLMTYPENAEIKFSRLKVFSITVPLMVEWQATDNKGWFINCGTLINFNTYASLKTRYKMEGRDVTETFKNIHQRPLTLDVLFQVGYNMLGVYVKYSKMNIFKTGYGPDMTPLTIGLAVYF